jgi:hypothetical protein
MHCIKYVSLLWQQANKDKNNYLYVQSELALKTAHNFEQVYLLEYNIV